MLVGIASWFLVTDNIDRAKWLSDHEKSASSIRIWNKVVG